MKEPEWVKTFAPRVEEHLKKKDNSLSVLTGFKLPYANEVCSYSSDGEPEPSSLKYETDLLVLETIGTKRIPRVIVEAKCHGSITTHDAITYSHKASTHRQVHPYIRYGILIGERKHYPLPGRLFRHGTQFDFMISWVGAEATSEEMDAFIELLYKEVEASRTMQDIIYNSRKRNRTHYTILHKELQVY
jgi:hypothetical protein